jgi:hypothetical protein
MRKDLQHEVQEVQNRMISMRSDQLTVGRKRAAHASTLEKKTPVEGGEKIGGPMGTWNHDKHETGIRISTPSEAKVSVSWKPKIREQTQGHVPRTVESALTESYHRVLSGLHATSRGPD